MLFSHLKVATSNLHQYNWLVQSWKLRILFFFFLYRGVLAMVDWFTETLGANKAAFKPHQGQPKWISATVGWFWAQARKDLLNQSGMGGEGRGGTTLFSNGKYFKTPSEANCTKSHCILAGLPAARAAFRCANNGKPPLWNSDEAPEGYSSTINHGESLPPYSLHPRVAPFPGQPSAHMIYSLERHKITHITLDFLLLRGIWSSGFPGCKLLSGSCL